MITDVSAVHVELQSVIAALAGDGQPFAAVYGRRLDDLANVRDMPALTVIPRLFNPQKRTTSGTTVYQPQFGFYAFVRKSRGASISVAEAQLMSGVPALCDLLNSVERHKPYWTKLALSTTQPIQPFRESGQVYLVATVFANAS
jgi:hypothetical protein